MPLSIPYEDSATIGTTLYSLPNDSTTLTPMTVEGIYAVFVDLSAMTVTEQYEVTILEKVTPAGAQLAIYQSVITGTTAPTLVYPSLYLKHGWDVQVRKLAGTDRSIGWSIRAAS